MLPHLGLPELLIILVIVLLIFGAKRLPEIGRSFGKTISSFKKGMKEAQQEESEEEKKEEKT
ncbi:MAG TPA: twin-arginine translocase TatA/TatE family subunit [Elusimicrobia bacterium]|jgi:sec-independent protein translocase protein TatA|nr:twin-arginine translocase TatA/TatE family subunit [Elusimicrobiota bacterium]